MSTIDTVIGKLEELLLIVKEGEEIPEEDLEQLDLGYVEMKVADILARLKDRTVLLLEWNEIDIQKAAREKLANMEDCEEDEIKENPLTREQVIDVIDLLDKYYDCNYGITWEAIQYQLDSISLPSSDICRINTPERLAEAGFICTDPDTNQWVKKLSSTHFIVYEKERMQRIALIDYTEEQLSEIVRGYYPSIQYLRETCLDDSNQIIAEIIAEQEA